jgi:signal transduction histidine kinase
LNNSVSSSPLADTAANDNHNKNENEITDVVYGIDNVIGTKLQFFSNSNIKIDTCMNYTLPRLAIALDPIRNAFINAKNRGVNLRCLTEITSENISYCKELMSIVSELRHLEGIKANFMLSESAYLAPVVSFEKGKVAARIIYSNVKELVEQHEYMFDTLWNKAIKDIIVEADKGRITQVVSNLLNNAVKFTQKGTITVSIGLERKKEDDYNDNVVISVEDTGHGIDSEILPKLFTKFTTKSETAGTGLGLFISKNIVEAHGGKMWAQNNPDDKGTTFAFSLPIMNK